MAKPKPLDMRQWVTPDDLNVSPEVLGLALASPTRRLLAMLLDLAVIGMISSLVNIWWLGALALVGIVHSRNQSEAGAAVKGVADQGTRAPEATGATGGAAATSGYGSAGARRAVARISALVRNPREWPRRQTLLLGLAAVLVVAGAMQSWQDHGRPRPAKHQRSADDGEAAEALAEAAERITDAAEAAAEAAAETARSGASSVGRPIVRRAGGAISSSVEQAAAASATAASAAGTVTAAAPPLPVASGLVADLPASAGSLAGQPASNPAAAASTPMAASTAANPVISAATTLALAQQADRIRKLEGQLSEARRARSLDPRVWLRRWADDLGLGYGFALVYFSLLPAWWGGQTVGKRLLRLRVVELTGKPMTALRNLKRFGGYAAGMATGGLGLIQLLWDSNRQAIQDKTAHTAVIDLRRPRLALQPPVLQEQEFSSLAPAEPSRQAVARRP